MLADLDTNLDSTFVRAHSVPCEWDVAAGILSETAIIDIDESRSTWQMFSCYHPRLKRIDISLTIFGDCLISVNDAEASLALLKEEMNKMRPGNVLAFAPTRLLLPAPTA